MSLSTYLVGGDDIVIGGFDNVVIICELVH